MPEHLVKLDRDQQRRRDDREVFRPALFPNQPEAFGEEDARVEERHSAQRLDLRVGDLAQVCQKIDDVWVVQVEVHRVQPVRDDSFHVLVYESEKAKREAGQQQALQQLEAADQHEASISGMVGLTHGAGLDAGCPRILQARSTINPRNAPLASMITSCTDAPRDGTKD